MSVIRVLEGLHAFSGGAIALGVAWVAGAGPAPALHNSRVSKET